MQHYDATTNPRRRAAAMLKMVILSPYFAPKIIWFW